MFTGDELIKQEIENKKNNEKYYMMVFKDFMSKISNVDIEYDYDSYSYKVRTLKKEYIYLSDHIDLFFSILNKYNYDMNHEIEDAIFYLGNLKDPNNNKELIDKLIKSPVINDISFNNWDRFKISSTLGDYEFELVSRRYRHNLEVMYYITHFHIYNMCHGNTYYLSRVFNDMNSITSKLSAAFTGRYYHSYTYNKSDNEIINLHSNSIMGKDKYDELFNPLEILNIENKDMEKAYRDTIINTDQDNARCKLLKIALYNEYNYFDKSLK